MSHSSVRELMTANPVLISPDATLQEAARKMQNVDCGVLPVGTVDKLEGMITDRDIVIRAIAIGKNPAEELVRDYMTERVIVCREGDTLEEAANKMHVHQVSRLVVQGITGKVAGILSLGNILHKEPFGEELAPIIKRAACTRAPAVHLPPEKNAADRPFL